MLVAVYGTLKRDEPNHETMLAARGRFQGEDMVDGITLYDLGYFPGAKRSKGRMAFVEVYEVDQEGLAMLDLLEGCHGDDETDHFVRRRVQTAYGEAWIYLYNSSVDGLRGMESWTSYAIVPPEPDIL